MRAKDALYELLDAKRKREHECVKLEACSEYMNNLLIFALSDVGALVVPA